MQGAHIRSNEAYLPYAAVTEDEAQRSRWTFYEVVNVQEFKVCKDMFKVRRKKFKVQGPVSSELGVQGQAPVPAWKLGV